MSDDTIKVGDRVRWNRMSDDKPFEGIVLEIHEHHARVQPIDRPDDRMWPWLNRLTRIDAPALSYDRADSVDATNRSEASE